MAEGSGAPCAWLRSLGADTDSSAQPAALGCVRLCAASPASEGG
jgi:hypothetical protein